MAGEIRIGKDASGRITVGLPYNPDHIAKIKSIEGYRWHPRERCWSIPSNDGVLERVFSLFDGEKIDIDPSLQSPREEVHNFEDLRRELLIRKYSPKTIKVYLHFNAELLRLAKKSPTGIIEEDVRNYLLYLAEQKLVSASTLNSAINALKFYF